MVVTAGTAALVAGCGSSTAGQSVARPPGTQPTSTTTTSGPTSSSKAPLTDLSNTAICELLTAGEATRLGGSEQGRPSYSTNQGQPICQWSADTSLNVAFGKNSRSSQAPTGEGITNSPTTVAGLTAVLSHKTGTPESCQVIVDVTDTATMAFLVGLHEGGKGKYEPCDTARRLAEIIIPKVKG
jgi:Protein of unknown function (DUF3558)